MYRLLIAAPLMTLGACAASTELEPAPGTPTTNPTTAVVSAPEARLSVSTRPWPGRARIERQVTPLRLTLENTGNEPWTVALADIVLEEAREGRFLKALPIEAVKGDARVWPSEREDLWVSPYYRSRGYVGRPAIWYSPYGTWGRQRGLSVDATADLAELPTPEMVRARLVPRTVAPGEQLEGWVYFPVIDAGEGPFELTVKLRAPDGAPIALPSLGFVEDDS